jgi:acyl-CoA reductase-like NAD-dependent aldehyde dehydrogenase
MNSSGFSTVNPSTGEHIERFSFFNSTETEAVLDRADKSFQSFRKLSLYRRAQFLFQLQKAINENLGDLNMTGVVKLFDKDVERVTRTFD